MKAPAWAGAVLVTIAKPPAISAPINANNFFMLLKLINQIEYKRIMALCDFVLHWGTAAHHKKWIHIATSITTKIKEYKNLKQAR